MSSSYSEESETYEEGTGEDTTSVFDRTRETEEYDTDDESGTTMDDSAGYDDTETQTEYTATGNTITETTRPKKASSKRHSSKSSKRSVTSSSKRVSSRFSDKNIKRIRIPIQVKIDPSEEPDHGEKRITKVVRLKDYLGIGSPHAIVDEIKSYSDSPIGGVSIEEAHTTFPGKIAVRARIPGVSVDTSASLFPGSSGPKEIIVVPGSSGKGSDIAHAIIIPGRVTSGVVEEKPKRIGKTIVDSLISRSLLDEPEVPWTEESIRKTITQDSDSKADVLLSVASPITAFMKDLYENGDKSMRIRPLGSGKKVGKYVANKETVDKVADDLIQNLKGRPNAFDLFKSVELEFRRIDIPESEVKSGTPWKQAPTYVLPMETAKSVMEKPHTIDLFFCYDIFLPNHSRESSTRKRK